jgi:hypothetical protein
MVEWLVFGPVITTTCSNKLGDDDETYPKRLRLHRRSTIKVKAKVKHGGHEEAIGDFGRAASRIRIRLLPTMPCIDFLPRRANSCHVC